MELTLQQLFGTGASQDAQSLIISKALPRLTASSNNRAEQLIVAILLQLLEQFEGKLTAPNGEAISDNQGREITYNNSKVYENIDCFQWKRYFKQPNYIVDSIIIKYLEPDGN